MTKGVKVVSISVVLLGAAIASAVFATGTVFGGGDDDGERPINGAALGKASAAALAYTGGGQVTETEVGDEESYYEVEVTLDDGTEVDVQLDENFNVVSADEDDEGEDGDDD